MSSPNIYELKQKAQEEYTRERRNLEYRLAELERVHKARLDAIDWIVSQKGGEESDGTAFEQVFDSLNRQFTRMDVEAAILEELGEEESPSRATLVKELENFVETGRLRIAQQGRGRRATIYQKVEPVE